MKILQYVGEGKGMMSGVVEYIVITEDNRNPSDHLCPGFKLYKSHQLNEDLPQELPLETILTAR